MLQINLEYQVLDVLLRWAGWLGSDSLHISTVAGFFLSSHSKRKLGVSPGEPLLSEH